jgi:HEAT repeat protein
VVVVVGHSGEVAAPDAAGAPSAGDGAADAVLKPATEPAETDGTGAGEPPVVDRRRTVALAGHRRDETVARSGLNDPSAPVRATALGALERLGALRDREVTAALADPHPTVRRRACELAASRPAVPLAELVADRDDTVVEMAAWSLGERGERSAVASLSALAAMDTGHRDPLCREAAVAALGAIGDPSGLPAVLAGLDDKPAVRRRAAVALAAFDGPEVEAALRRCLEDRDWQVRQVAEDLLAVE